MSKLKYQTESPRSGNLLPRRSYTNGKHMYAITIHKHQVKHFVDKGDIDQVKDAISGRIPGQHLEGAYEISPKYN